MSRGLAPTRPSYRLSPCGSLPLRIPEAANDNVPPGRLAQSEAELRAALDHFSRHHLNAAHDAFDRAKIALEDGDEAGFLYWADICRALDRRLAGTLTGARSGPP